MELYYRNERDADFMSACERVQKENPQLSARRIAQKAIMEGAGSFYLHTREYARIIRREGRIFPRNLVKRKMHRDILIAGKRIREANPAITLPELIKNICESGAPRFYLSESRARDLYYSLLKGG
jgi:hypothetical protein